DPVPAARLRERAVRQGVGLARHAQQQAQLSPVEHREDRRRAQLLLEPELLAVERHRGVEVVNEVADGGAPSESRLLARLEAAQERGGELRTWVDGNDRQTKCVERITRHGSPSS